MPILTERERIGTRLAGKYDLSAILGRGGMGTVYAGVHAWTGRRVAVKLLRPALAEDSNVVRRFLREARAAGAIRHPHVVDVLDMGQEDDGAVYMVLELLEGESLGSLLRRRGRLTPEELLPIVLPVVDALVDVHAKGLVHRDIKPDNLFVARGRGDRVLPKLLDFGIAKILEDTGGTPGTRTGAIVGTPHYMSPEQASGSGEIGPASDVWSFGVLMFECLTGRLPFEADTATGVLVKILTTAPPSVPALAPEIPRPLVRVIEHAMQSDAAARFLDARVLRDALRDAAEELGIEIPDEVPHEASATDPDADLVPIDVGSVERAAPETAPRSGFERRPRAVPHGAPRASDSASESAPRSVLESAPTIASQPPTRAPEVARAAEVIATPSPRRSWAPIAIGVAAVAVIAGVAYTLGASSSSSDGADDTPAHEDGERPADAPARSAGAPGERVAETAPDAGTRTAEATTTPHAAEATTAQQAAEHTTRAETTTPPSATTTGAPETTTTAARAGGRARATARPRTPQETEAPAEAPPSEREGLPGVRTEW